MRRFAIGFAVLAALGALASVAAPRGLADFAAFAPRQTLWREGQRFPAPSEPQWMRGREQLQAAHAQDNRNPVRLEDLAAWHERAALYLPRGDAAGRAYLEHSLEQLRLAAVLRPASPYTWANIALVKLRLGETDRELASAVTSAARLGPWEPGVQLTLAEVLFAASDRLPGPARTAAAGAVVNGLKYNEARIFSRAYALGRLDVLCSLPGVARSRLATRCI